MNYFKNNPILFSHYVVTLHSWQKSQEGTQERAGQKKLLQIGGGNHLNELKESKNGKI